MRIAVSHTTHYRFTRPSAHALQRLHLRPRDSSVQKVANWSLTVEGGLIEAGYEDHNQNLTTLVSLLPGALELSITCEGIVETRDCAGVVGAHTGFMPLWVSRNQTALTEPGSKLRALAAGFATQGAVGLDGLHGLADAVRDAVAYQPGHTDADTNAEEALVAGRGVCQDHAHIFIGAARALGVPARYVSGYLLMDDTTQQQAGHAWAEAWVADLGWVGFDVSNAICPDERYIRLAVGVDYRDVAPVTGLVVGAADGMVSELAVDLAVGRLFAEQ